MESYDRHSSDDFAAISALLPPPPAPGTSVADRAWTRLEQRIRRRSVIPRWRALPSRRPFAARAALTAAVPCAAAAVTAASLILSGGQAKPVPVAGPSVELRGSSARPFLIAMATKAAQQKIGRFYCQDFVQGDRELVGNRDAILPRPWLDGPARVRASAPPGFRYALLRRYRFADCTRGTRLAWHATLDQYLGARPASPADARAWRRDGSPSHWRDGQGILSAHSGRARSETFVKPGRGEFGLANYLKLPAGPAKLRAFLLAHPSP